MVYWSTIILEEHTASIFSVEDEVKLETNNMQVATIQ
jgi:hypothetical protein